ncbi:MAG TPA: anhydro-N-acetylmuramic acid kinase [Candidatus Limnocylindria bacterium]|nr:anhydro-N-acetylmuramic acid kinase [Candidatus Limnocylindria bacterium]
MIVVGLMSGTSADGIEAAAADVDPQRGTARLVGHRHWRYPNELRERVLAAGSAVPLTGEQLATLNADLGEANAAAVRALLDELGRSADLVAMHGQTIAHYPERHTTYQLADGARVAARTGVPVVCDFRSADVALGGQGAPLVPFADHVLFGDRAPIALLNVGGIANLTLLPTTRAEDAVAFDCGPGNMVVDALVAASGERFDRDGERARRGRPRAKALRAALAHPYFARRAPKSTGREEFGAPFARSLLDDVRSEGGSEDDALATAVALTAQTVAAALARETPAGVRWRELVVAGGGAANLAIMDALREAVTPVPVRPMDELGVPAPVREALAFAILGAYRAAGLPNTLPRCTGASRAVSAGALHAP